MTSIVKRPAPSALVRMGNPLVRLILVSPLHRVLDGSVLILHVPGRESGRRYNIPVDYANMGGKLIIVTMARWRVNLRGRTEVEVTLHGHRQPMHVVIDEDPASVAVSYHAVITRIGWKKARRQFGIALPGGPAPTVLELADAARQYGWSVITLSPP
jgi:hypothetical protein